MTEAKADRPVYYVVEKFCDYSYRMEFDRMFLRRDAADAYVSAHELPGDFQVTEFDAGEDLVEAIRALEQVRKVKELLSALCADTFPNGTVEAVRKVVGAA